MNTHTGMISTV